MREGSASFLVEQLHGLETQPPNYDYDGLTLPEGLTVDAFFGSHAYVGDLSATRAKLREYDFVVIENIGWDAPTMKLMQKIANGNYAAREKMSREIQLQNPERKDHLMLGVNSIYDVKKSLIVIDPPYGNPIHRKLVKHFEGATQGFSPDFSTAVANHKTKIIDHASINLARENFMLRSFCEQFNAMAETDKKLSDLMRKVGVSIVMFNFGFTHAGLYNGMREVAKRCGVSFEGEVYVDSGPEVIVDYAGQACGRLAHGLEIDDLLVAKDMVSKVLSHRAINQKEDNKPTLVGAVTLAIKQIDGFGMPKLSELYSTF